MSSWFLGPMQSLCKREMLRFWRQKSRLFGSLAQPLVFWVVFGAGLSGSFQYSVTSNQNASYQEYFLPGSAVLIVMFTAIFSSISVIEDRQEGFLQGVLVAPISNVAIVSGKVAGGVLLAVSQAMLFLGLGFLVCAFGWGPPLGMAISGPSSFALLVLLILMATWLGALGFSIAWKLNSVQGFHALMSVGLIPMWLVSGAVFPVPASGWMHWLMWANPLMYGVAGVRRLLYSETIVASDLPRLAACFLVSAGTTAVFVTVAMCVIGNRAQGRRVIK